MGRTQNKSAAEAAAAREQQRREELEALNALGRQLLQDNPGSREPSYVNVGPWARHKARVRRRGR
jgi:hypothetical protein